MIVRLCFEFAVTIGDFFILHFISVNLLFLDHFPVYFFSEPPLHSPGELTIYSVHFIWIIK